MQKGLLSSVMEFGRSFRWDFLLKGRNQAVGEIVNNVLLYWFGLENFYKFPVRRVVLVFFPSCNDIHIRTGVVF